MIELRDFQADIVSQACESTSDDIVQLDTGAGKTRCIAEIARRSELCLVVAHRNILIKQLSREFASHNIWHDLVATQQTRRLCLREHRRVGGDRLRKSNIYVCSIDSIFARLRRDLLQLDTHAKWRILIDEGHHARADNKWGLLKSLFPNSQITGFTATPQTTSGKALSKTSGGIYDKMIQAKSLSDGNSVAKLISMGYLSHFEAWDCKDLLEDEALSERNGEFVYHELNSATFAHKYEMAGDAVKQYKRLANGKQTIAFCVSIDIANDTAEYFRASGIASAAISSRMTYTESRRIFDLFESGQIQVLCHVDMLGEGVDVPQVECIIMMRKTASISIYRQWCGRLMRPAHGKEKGIILDHVGNVRRHGLPDAARIWSIERVPDDVFSNVIACAECDFLFSALKLTCPRCKAQRDIPEEDEEKGYRVTSQKYVDWQMIKLGESRRIQEWNHENKINILNSPRPRLAGVDAAIYDLKFWAANAVSSQDIPEINNWMDEGNAYWIKNFKLSDINTANEKPMDKFKKWQSR